MTAARHSTKNFAVVGLFNPHHLLTMPSLHLLGEKENEADRSEGMCPSSQLEEGGARCEIQAVRLQRRPSQTLPLRDSGLSDGDVGKLGLWRITHSTPWNTPIYNCPIVNPILDELFYNDVLEHLFIIKNKIDIKKM